MKMTLICGDCFKILPHIESESIDLVLADPPYNISSEVVPVYDVRGKKGRRPIYLNAEWDKYSEKDYLRKMYFFVKEVKRVLKPSGTFICFTSDKYLSYLRHFVILNGMVYRQTCIWIKSNPVPQLRKVKFQHATELFFLVHKEKGHRPNVFYHPIVSGKERTKHPTQKPLWLFKELISYTTRENDVVLDPFLGSGTTMKACLELNRNCIGIEINREYIDIIKKRLNWGSTLENVEFEYIEWK